MSSRLFPLAWLAAGTAACMPRGDPPAGRQIVAERTAALAGIVPPTGDGTVRVLFVRPGPDPTVSDLYVASVPSDGTPPSERLLGTLAANFGGACLPGQGLCFPSDARGRVFFASNFDESTGAANVARVDPVTGDRLDIQSGYYLLSPSGLRLLVFPAVGRGANSDATLYEADDTTRVIDGSDAFFIGEDVYYLTAEKDLMRIAPAGSPQLMASGIVAFGAQGTTNALVMLSRPTATPNVNTFSILDPATLEETPSPFGSEQFTVSPDGRWLLNSEYNADLSGATLTFFDRLTGTQDVWDVPPALAGGYEWRPGHDEIWIGNGQVAPPTTVIKRPGEPPVSVPAWPFALSEASSGVSSLFTRDGAYWFLSSSGLETGMPKIQVASADDPVGSRFDLVPNGNASYLYWRLADGRILMPRYVRLPTRTDIVAIDPANGDARLLGAEGMVTAVGQTRLLATLHVVDGLGDLTAIELATGRKTVLAPECSVVAVVERQGADAVAPGAHVAYYFRARFDSPYDGIWLATVP